MRVWSRLEWRQQSRLLDERDRLRRLHDGLRVAATSRRDMTSPMTKPRFRPTRSKAVSPPWTKRSSVSTRVVTAYALCVDRESRMNGMRPCPQRLFA